jgi:hypothetical protein
MYYFEFYDRRFGPLRVRPTFLADLDDDITIVIGAQEDREALSSLVAHTGLVDVVIEDGGHMMGQQIARFEV